MTMRTKPDVDTLSIDDLYNNLRVFEQELTSTSKSSASAQNVAFVSHSKSSTNKVKSGHTGAYSTYTPSTSSNNIPEREVPAGFADEVIYSLFAKQSEDLDLLHEDLEQIDDMDIEEMDINWQIAMIAIRMKKFYKKTGRRVRIDGNKPVGFDKKKLECFKCHNTGHFARECPSKGTNDGKKRDSFYQDQGAGKKEQNQNCLLTMDDGVVNWGEHTEEEVETNHALMAISSNNEVSLCSKTCIDSYNKLKTLCDEQTNQLGEQEVKILAYDQAVKKLEAQVVTFQKQQLSLNEQLTFQANALYEKDEKLKKYRRIGMKAVKEKEQLQKTVDSWKDSSKNLWKLVDSGMSSTSKVGLGYEIKSNDEVLSYEEEMNRTVFNCTEEDFIDKPLYSRFSKTDSFKGVPHPLTGDYTPKPQQEIDESLYVYGKKGPQKPEISDSDDKSNEHSTCQSNDSEGSFGNPSEHSSESESESISIPNEMSTSKSVTTNEKVVSESKEVEPSCVTHVKTPRQQMKNQETHKVNGKNWDEMMERKLGEGYSFIKKKCFVCGSLSHLIRDCDFYEKKMVREAELKKQRVFNTGNGVAKPVWNNANRVNHANHFVPRPVQLNTGRANVNSVRQNVNSVRPNVNTGRANVNSVRQNVNSVRSNVNTGSFNINTVKAKQPINTSNSNSFSPVRPQGTAVKTSAGYNWRKTRPNSNCNSGSNFIRTDHPLKNMEDRGIFDSGCSGHMTGNKDHLDDFEECKGGSVTFGGSKGYITSKGRIRVGNLDFDSVSFVKELGHFNLFSISQICDKHHKVLFTETECLVVSPDFKMPDENQILLQVPRQHNMYSFDMKTPALTKDYSCLIAKATSDESKLWYRRFSWVFFLATKDETSGILHNFIRQIENQLNYRNGVAERMNRTLIEASRTMLADSLLPTTFWTEAVSTACYIFNRVRVKQPQNKTPYELCLAQTIYSYIRPFGVPVTILDTLSVVGKFVGMSDDGFLVGTSEVTNSACTLQTPNANASEEEDEAEELIVVPTAVRHTAAKVRPRKSSTNSKAEEFLTELQNLKTQEKEAYSTGISEDTPEILAFRRELDELALKHLREVPKNKATSTTSVKKSKVASQRSKSVDKGKRYKRRKESKGKDIDTGFEDISTGFEEVNTGGLGVSTGSGPVSSARGQREGKAPMIVEETQAPKRTKEQIQQEEASLAEAIRLQTLEEEETAKQVHLDALLAKRLAEEEELTEQQKKRKAQVQFEAQFYTEEDWDAIRAKLEANAELTKDVLGKDLSEQDFAKRMVDLVNQRKKHFAEERAKAKRNKPMTQSQLRIYMSNYLKNQGTWKLSQLKKLKFEEIKEEFEKLVKQIDTFVPINIEATKAQLKRYGEELQTEISKKQRIDDKDVSDTEEKVGKVKEEEPVKRVGKRKKQKARKGISIDKSPQGDSETDKEESVEAMNPTPLDTKSNIVANWKIFQQGERSIYQIIRANGADTVYMSFGAMLKDFTREDLIELYRLVMQKYGTNRPEDAYDRVLWSDLRTMFDPPLNEDAIWSLPLQQKMISWRYYDKCAVHCLTLEACNIYMLADRKYPLSKDACQVMLKMKLLDGKMNEVCYKLLKMIEKQAGVKK
ncbi:putative ribonuclease H-like domain-containing protein [Tanacetum coccineum]|uniref:Ribonuclease H-like domain-containing protein n=1 Tax=Tanacetum coccineum TaxID=301880 RepID=A0ABQ5IHS3_9ASTR